MEERKSFVFYRGFYEALSDLPDEERLAVYDAICQYALDDVLPKTTGVISALFKMAKPQIDANIRRYQNGSKGGRPKAETEPRQNLTETKVKPKDNQNITKEEPKQNLTETKVKPNVNDNDNVNVNDNNKNIKHKHGNYKHVLLSDSELEKLNAEHGMNVVKDAIQVVDDYCETSGKRYKNYSLVLQKWGIKEAKEKTKKQTGSRYDIGALESALLWQ